MKKLINLCIMLLACSFGKIYPVLTVKNGTPFRIRIDTKQTGGPKLTNLKKVVGPNMLIHPWEIDKKLSDEFNLKVKRGQNYKFTRTITLESRPEHTISLEYQLSSEGVFRKKDLLRTWLSVQGTKIDLNDIPQGTKTYEFGNVLGTRSYDQEEQGEIVEGRGGKALLKVIRSTRHGTVSFDIYTLKFELK